MLKVFYHMMEEDRIIKTFDVVFSTEYNRWTWERSQLGHPWLHIVSYKEETCEIKDTLHRILISIEGISQEGKIRINIPSWVGDGVGEKSVIVPISVINPLLHDQLKVGMHLLGEVNIGNENWYQLIIKNVEILPEET